MLIETKLGTLYVERRGEGEPVVLWHALLSHGGIWRAQAAALAERYDVINVDAPGHGRSGPVPGAFTLEDCVDVLAAVLDALGVARARIAGLSWGGMVALRFALRHPDRVRALALLGTTARAEPPARRLAYGALARAAVALVAARGAASLVTPTMFSRATRRARPELVDDFVTGLVRMDPTSVRHAVDAVVVRRRAIVDALPRVRVRTLVLVGQDDLATPPRESALLAERLPNARLVTIAGAGHLVPVEQPKPATAELLGWAAEA